MAKEERSTPRYLPTHGSGSGTAPIPNNSRYPQRSNLYPQAVPEDFPLSFAILAHSLFTHPLLAQLQAYPQVDPSQTRHEWTLLLLFQFFYLIFLFAFSLLSTAAVVFTVASLYTSKPVSFSSTMSAIPKVFKRLFVTVVSVLEPVHGFAAMKKSYELLKGKTRYAGALVFIYLAFCLVIGGVFGSVVVHGGNEYGVFARIVVGGFLVGVLVIVNLVGLLVQSVFYYVCKSCHRQGIDKTALHDHLGGYLGEYVPLKSSVQMENFEI
ncbi:hypothetical protein CJ030_MR2G028805 [Morella rubra]|uniref:Uncharacterized protein n=1 Tax=Morella rubra TaxID=262757 RepID=A0A6A1WCR8_9ROSI|nr:hypothetical protein CJ030_MR2G028805 [Morella rubra]